MVTQAQVPCLTRCHLDCAHDPATALEVGCRRPGVTRRPETLAFPHTMAPKGQRVPWHLVRRSLKQQMGDKFSKWLAAWLVRLGLAHPSLLIVRARCAWLEGLCAAWMLTPPSGSEAQRLPCCHATAPKKALAAGGRCKGTSTPARGEGRAGGRQRQQDARTLSWPGVS